MSILIDIFYIFLLLLLLGSFSLFTRYDFSEKRLKESKFTDRQQIMARGIRKKQRKGLFFIFLIYLIWSLIFFSITTLKNADFVTILLVQFIYLLIAGVLFLVPPIRNLSTNIADMIISKIYMLFDNELTREKIMLEGSRDNYTSKELLQKMRKAAEDEIMKQSFSFGLSGVSKIQFINEDDSLTEQQKRAHKIGILLQAKKYKRYFSIGLTISGILLAFGLLFWWPLLIIAFLSFIWGLNWQISIRGLLGNNSQVIKSEVERLGGEQAINESSYWNAFAKSSGMSEEDQAVVNKIFCPI